MCGRFTLHSDNQKIADTFGLQGIELAPRYNICPTQYIHVIRSVDGLRHLVPMRWGLIPSWSKKMDLSFKLFNARAETVHKKPSYSQVLKTKRCLIPADGFYEWKQVGAQKYPYFIHLKQNHPFAFAGLWDQWQGPDELIESCTIITTQANRLLMQLHDRMPVILDSSEYDFWLNPQIQDVQNLLPMLDQYKEQNIEFHPVGLSVNNPRVNGPELITTAEEQPT